MTLVEEYKRQATWRNWESYLEEIPIRPQDIVIDIGCSIGAVSRMFSARVSQVIGIDSNPDLLAEAKRINPAGNISYRLLDAKSLKDQDLPKADGIWASFVPAYMPDFYPVLRSWIQFLEPGGWIALVEMSDLFGHEPLSDSTKRIFDDYYEQQLRQKQYDFKMGSRLRHFLMQCGFAIMHEENKQDAELNFRGPAKMEILQAWENRFDRMHLFRQRLGESEFNQVKSEFLSCLSDKNHYSNTLVKFLVARY